MVDKKSGPCELVKKPRTWWDRLIKSNCCGENVNSLGRMLFPKASTEEY